MMGILVTLVRDEYVVLLDRLNRRHNDGIVEKVCLQSSRGDEAGNVCKDTVAVIVECLVLLTLGVDEELVEKLWLCSDGVDTQILQ